MKFFWTDPNGCCRGECSDPYDSDFRVPSFSALNTIVAILPHFRCSLFDAIWSFCWCWVVWSSPFILLDWLYQNSDGDGCEDIWLCTCYWGAIWWELVFPLFFRFITDYWMFCSINRWESKPHLTYFATLIIVVFVLTLSSITQEDLSS